MKKTFGFLTDNKELIEELKDIQSSAAIIAYKTLDTVKKEDFSLLLIDCDVFESPDSIQFYLSKVRKKIQEKPVLLVIKPSQIQDISIDWFFDDFIIYPFRRVELSTRIHRLLWQKSENEDLISIGRLKINLKEYSVYLDDEKVDLTYKEFEILRLLVQNKGEVFSRKDLLSKIWGLEYIGGTRTVDVHIRRLRGKLGEEFNTVIETVRNVGYRCIL